MLISYNILLYIFSPALAFPFILLGIRNRKKGFVFLLALFFGILAYCTIPLQDLYRQMENYEYYSTFKWGDFTLLDFEMNGAIVYLYCLMGKLSIPYDILRFFTVSIGYYLLFLIFEFKITKGRKSVKVLKFEGSKILVGSKKYTKTEYFVRFLIFTLFFDLFYTISGVRYGFSLCLYLYGTYLFFERDSKILSVIFLIFSALFHTSFIFTIPVSYFLYFLKLDRKKFILVTLLSFLGMTIIFSKFGFLLGVRENWYVNSSGGTTDYSAMTLFGFLGFVLPKICVIPYAYILIKNYNDKSKWMRMSLVWFSISLICLTNAVFLYRFWWVFMSIGIYMYIDYEKINGKNEYSSKVLLVSSALFALFSLIPSKSFLLHSNYSKLLMPIPITFSRHYTTDEVLHEIPTAGDFVSEN